MKNWITYHRYGLIINYLWLVVMFDGQGNCVEDDSSQNNILTEWRRDKLPELRQMLTKSKNWISPVSGLCDWVPLLTLVLLATQTRGISAAFNFYKTILRSGVTNLILIKL